MSGRTLPSEAGNPVTPVDLAPASSAAAAGLELPAIDAGHVESGRLRFDIFAAMIAR